MNVMIDRLEMAVCAKFCSAAPLDSELDTVSRTISRCPIRFEANSDVPPPSLAEHHGINVLLLFSTIVRALP